MAIGKELRSIGPGLSAMGCGCTFAGGPHTYRRAARCARHQLTCPRGVFTETHYRGIGSVFSATPPHVEEFAEGFGELPTVPEGELRDLLEVGGGVSPYIGMVRRAGYRYTLLEPSEFACRHMREMFAAECFCCGEDQYEPDRQYSVILSAHSLEHLRDAPAALRRWYDWLLPGGVLYLLAPEGSDFRNKDHEWFFDALGIVAEVKQAGFVVVSCVQKQITQKEDYLYVKAIRPSK